MAKVKSSKTYLAFLLVAVLLVPQTGAWLDAWGELTTGKVGINNPLLVAKSDNTLELNERDSIVAENLSISGQELIHFDSKKLPGNRLDESKIDMRLKAKTLETHSQTLELRLRYTNQTGTFIACSQEVLIQPSNLKNYSSSCSTDIESEEDVKYHYEIIGSPKTDYRVSIDGSTHIEVDVKQ